jgi:hypothetical protein
MNLNIQTNCVDNILRDLVLLNIANDSDSKPIFKPQTNFDGLKSHRSWYNELIEQREYWKTDPETPIDSIQNIQLMNVLNLLRRFNTKGVSLFLQVSVDNELLISKVVESKIFNLIIYPNARNTFWSMSDKSNGNRFVKDLNSDYGANLESLVIAFITAD